MGDRNTSLVDTKVSWDAAAEVAFKCYRRLVDHGVILPTLRSDICLSEAAFAVRRDYRGFDRLNDLPTAPPEDSATVPRDALVNSNIRPVVKGIEIHVVGFHWQSDATGALTLQPDAIDTPSAEGLFFNFEGGFRVDCPHCDTNIELGGDETERLDDVLTTWCKASVPSKGQTTVQCPCCNHVATLQAWRSREQNFAAGYVGLTLWGEHLLTLTYQPDHPDNKPAWEVLCGDMADQNPAIVCCHI
ncbi:hypothetical protein [Burkholderia sp. Ax-1719]|uniref:hypothetical protein n=1 Tax=Burkholderia sp. Ax-1719 TaxID=2608334 RepID=UPI0014233D5E|nr:hypothetical protein [Burkholderia sp. Ax-1719]NIE64371.1 hypothetical protein [Burkholderia sp. Ax-1719]